MSINKFSKYGIVLVAAITLATAVQTQFGQSSTKVYAEETASDANYKDYRMFYVYSADYPDEPNSGGMAGRVIKPSEPYVVDENFRAPGTYSHYDVFDDTGKHYNVGDIITVNDPLVNHKNEEDNRLYYYYYPLNSDNTSEAPANSTTPATSENPISDNDPRLNRMLYINVSSPDDPTLGWLTGEVVTPKGYIVKSAGEVEGFPYFTITGSNGKNYSVGDIITTEEPGLFGHANYEDDALYYRYYRTNPNSVSEAPANNTTPATSEAPAVSTTPATSEAPANSTTPATSETPAVSTTPATSEAPAASTAPATSETPAVSTTPTTSEAPAASTTPATSETPAVSTTPATSEAPAVSTTPATGLVPSKNIHSMNSVTSPFTQTRNAGIKSEADGKLTSHDLPKTGDTNSKVGMLGMVLVGLGLTSFVYKGRHRRS
ncbi:LPXTG cell wall anchor domain-containing protein [Streptococcus sp. 22.1]|uniref:LPXTG cell wall anchor domain-containing protein n=1 Tax=Streptococcus TaxID=1301 RepID=UPI0015E88FA3|nr:MULTISPECIES: LPXTG cell wall anchor domain-containing protein [Streptococcus]MBK5079648.1 LPXTG cell wall anchor domain-containing protein [Streptococcus sp. 22.1]